MSASSGIKRTWYRLRTDFNRATCSSNRKDYLRLKTRLSTGRLHTTPTGLFPISSSYVTMSLTIHFCSYRMVTAFTVRKSLSQILICYGRLVRPLLQLWIRKLHQLLKSCITKFPSGFFLIIYALW
jgi:hypothetical protein